MLVFALVRKKGLGARMRLSNKLLHKWIELESKIALVTVLFDLNDVIGFISNNILLLS